MKRSAVVLALLAALTLTGCAGAADESPAEAQDASVTAQSATEESPAPVESEPAEAETPAYITEPGEVCDPHNANDPICAAFYPDQVVINMTTRVPELAALPEAERITLAQEACDSPSDSPIHTIAAVAYCNDQIAPGSFDGMPDRTARLIAFYQGIGEEAAKAHFADRIMPTADELGY